VRIIMVGSGIAGLSAAIGLRKAGIDVTVYERLLTWVRSGSRRFCYNTLQVGAGGPR
jgi:2-polyprenyl-6-methoxyphenol hydroxylase-like FAD-dependent oxidoreductase